MRTFTDSDTWYASLPTLYAAAAALITSRDGRVLLVKPNYRDHWSLPGGVLEDGEAPHAGAAREVAEEIGLTLTLGRLLALDWAPPDSGRPRPVVFFVFDGGEVDAEVPITLQEDELDDYRFTSPDELETYLPSMIETRVSAALRARAMNAAIYVPAWTR